MMEYLRFHSFVQKTWRSLLLLVPCLFFCQVVSAENYYWRVSNTPAAGTFPSFAAAIAGYI
ncbi:hypothetical protein, partial [Pseudomonas sp. SST3]